MGSLIVPSVEAAIALAQFIQTTITMYQQKTITSNQLQQLWATVGINTNAANKAWEEATGSAPVGGA
jgi:hypothetical protein